MDDVVGLCRWGAVFYVGPNCYQHHRKDDCLQRKIADGRAYVLRKESSSSRVVEFIIHLMLRSACYQRAKRYLTVQHLRNDPGAGEMAQSRICQIVRAADGGRVCETARRFETRSVEPVSRRGPLCL